MLHVKINSIVQKCTLLIVFDQKTTIWKKSRMAQLTNLLRSETINPTSRNNASRGLCTRTTCRSNPPKPMYKFVHWTARIWPPPRRHWNGSLMRIRSGNNITARWINVVNEPIMWTNKQNKNQYLSIYYLCPVHTVHTVHTYFLFFVFVFWKTFLDIKNIQIYIIH